MTLITFANNSVRPGSIIRIEKRIPSVWELTRRGGHATITMELNTGTTLEEKIPAGLYANTFYEDVNRRFNEIKKAIEDNLPDG